MNIAKTKSLRVNHFGHHDLKKIVFSLFQLLEGRLFEGVSPSGEPGRIGIHTMVRIAMREY